jgi:hypothetical protein
VEREIDIVREKSLASIENTILENLEKDSKDDLENYRVVKKVVLLI